VDEPRRNDAFDQELRRAFAAGGGAPSGPHVDAEVAAAWIEQRLDEPARLAVETHLADCFDCQAMLATLARISPEGATARGEGLAWWRRLRAGWLVPATLAAAAALVIWVAVPEQRRASESVQSLTVPSSAPSPATTPDAAAPQTEPLEAERKALRQQPASPPPPAAAAAPSAPAAVAPVPPALERRERFADAAAPAAPEAAPAAPQRAPAAESDKASAKLEADAPAVDGLRNNRITVTGETPAAPPAPARQDAAAERPRGLNESITVGGALGATNAARAAGSSLTVAADGAARWRRDGVRIEFAPRGGASFVATSLPLAADALVAASAPGGTVCWMAGRAGVVIVTTDGVRFVRTAVPTSSNLVAIAATDARTALVTAADGRRYRTTDAGTTWSPLP
jgi:hypothetical protein